MVKQGEKKAELHVSMRQPPHVGLDINGAFIWFLSFSLLYPVIHLTWLSFILPTSMPSLRNYEFEKQRCKNPLKNITCKSKNL
jgi:hypothetical protein